MVTTRAQNLSVNRVGQNPGDAYPPSLVLVHAAPPPSQPSMIEHSPLASLAQQIQVLVTVAQILTTTVQGM